MRSSGQRSQCKRWQCRPARTIHCCTHRCCVASCLRRVRSVPLQSAMLRAVLCSGLRAMSKLRAASGEAVVNYFLTLWGQFLLLHIAEAPQERVQELSKLGV